MYEIINRTDDKADVASVLLFTDGQANVGIDNRQDILEEMEKAINPPRQFTVSCITCTVMTVCLKIRIVCSRENPFHIKATCKGLGTSKPRFGHKRALVVICVYVQYFIAFLIYNNLLCEY